ncbi:hypothetical protein [Rhizobium sp. Leaf371]|uniref:P-loop ATPase, Sll1717 family n=1 Tax=Rhizobium sp. Leaf371 TaxID=1736355 RepID=UPI000B2EF50C|nr:hypothetical protein [Rhizobium sp. Leaf371]
MNIQNALEVLKKSTFGHRTAEEEKDNIKQYFVETEDWNSVFSGKADIIYGAKGSGKSAIYSLIIENQSELFDRNILVIPGENPQGTPAFQSLSQNPPESEFAFVSLWKLYFLTLCGKAFRDYEISNPLAVEIIGALEEANLLPRSFTLSRALTYALHYVRDWTARIEAVEGTVTIDPTTSIPMGAGKISLREPSSARAKLGHISVDELLSKANAAFAKEELTVWVVLDRLDVAFSDNSALEALALRALFKAYLDIKNLNSIRTKIFLRTDIWKSIVKDGFREASHLERTLTIRWREDDILNVLVRRMLSNDSIAKYYGVDRIEILGDATKQRDIFFRMMPAQVESGPNKSNTLKWMITRTSDASKEPAPRELIHMMNELRTEQIKRLERGQKGLVPEKALFEQVSFKDALPAVSRARLEQTLYAEYARLKPYVEKMRQQRASQTVESLATLWGIPQSETQLVVNELEDAGFFEKFAGTKAPTVRVPFLYRPALELVQGTVELDQGTTERAFEAE